MARVNAVLAQGNTTNPQQWGGAGRMVQTDANTFYAFYTDNGQDFAYRKSTDGCKSFGQAVIIKSGTMAAFDTFYDKDAGLATAYINLFYGDQVSNDLLFRTIDTASSDALSTETVIVAGASIASGGDVSGWRTRGGNVYCNGVIDAGVEGGFFKLLLANFPNGAWEAALASPEALATQDQWQGAPGFAADNQDSIMLFVDASANGFSRRNYDDSGNAWDENALVADGSFTDVVATTSYPNFNLAVDLSNSRLVVVAWNAVDAANADLQCWTVTESAGTAKTDVVANSTDDQGLAAVSINTVDGGWYVFYVGKSDGSETLGTSVNVYYKVSFDSGATWSSETALTTLGRDIDWIATVPRALSAGVPPVLYHSDGTNDDYYINFEAGGGGGMRLAGRGGLAG